MPGSTPSADPLADLLATKYRPELESRALEILEAHPHLATRRWDGPDTEGEPFVRGATPLHYAANDGKLRLMRRLLDLGADADASEANWYRSVLAWAANNARLEAIDLLLSSGASPRALDALHAAASRRPSPPRWPHPARHGPPERQPPRRSLASEPRSRVNRHGVVADDGASTLSAARQRY